jgi:hypothetical protein
MKLTKTEVDNLIATEVYGWVLDDDHGTCCHPTTREWRKPYTHTKKNGESYDSTAIVCFQSNFTPTDNVEQALKALERFFNRGYHTVMQSDINGHKVICYSYKTTEYYTAYNKSLKIAICEALASAVKKELVIIEED